MKTIRVDKYFMKNSFSGLHVKVIQNSPMHYWFKLTPGLPDNTSIICINKCVLA